MRPIAIGYGAALMATVIWAGNFVAARALADLIPPCQFNLWRWVIALIALLPFAIAHWRHDFPLCRRHFKYLSVMALLGVTLMNTLVYKAGQTTESLNMALIMPATPVVILILARIFYHERISPQRFIGMLIAAGGVVFLISRGDWSRLLNLEFMSGDLWTLASMACFALYSLLMRQRPEGISPVGFNVAVFGLGIVYALPMVAVEMRMLPLPTLNLSVVSGLLYAGIGCSAISFWLWTVGIDRIGPVKAGIVYYSLPLFAAIMADIVLNENVNSTQVVGGAMIISGIFVATVLGAPRRKE